MSTEHTIDLGAIKRVHFIGIGGIGMSGLARLFLGEGKVVSGSDRAPSDITRALETEGATIYHAQVRENITHRGTEALPDLIVYTEAMAHDQEEMVAAKALDVPMMNYFEALGLIANEYYLIAVAGTHGKTTSTAMLIDVFEAAGLDPSAIVGSLRARTQSNYRKGKGKYFIVEACEYKRDFLSLTPDVLVITNIEHDHVDYYKTLEEVQAAFRDFAGQVREGGAVIVNYSAPNIAPVLEGMTVSLLDYGKFFDPMLKLKVPGVHNQLNAAAARAVAQVCGIEDDVARAALSEFSGTWRRFEYKGEVNGAKVYDDYGHHPTAIRVTLQGARELYPDKKITLVFQSHTYTRTHELFDDFASALATADRAIVLPIYAAREENTSGVTHTKLAERVRSLNADAVAVDTVEEAVEMLRGSVSDNDVVLTMGAGDMTSKVANELVA